jgi:hypothetical protein
MQNRSFSALAAGLAIAFGALGCESRVETDEEIGTVPATEMDESRAEEAAGTPGATVNVADITGDPEEWIGQTVTVEADVEEVLSGYSFKLDEDAPLEGGVDNDLLVFSPKAANLASIDDQWLDNKVRVTGKVVRMTVVEIEREIGWDLDPTIEAELEDVRPVLIASSVERIEGDN